MASPKTNNLDDMLIPRDSRSSVSFQGSYQRDSEFSSNVSYSPGYHNQSPGMDVPRNSTIGISMHDNPAALPHSHSRDTHATKRPHRSVNFLNDEDHTRNSQFKTRRGDLATVNFYKQEHWFTELCEILFKVKERGSSVQMEIYYGFIHFISCLYILAVAPQQLAKAGYDVSFTVVAIGLCCGIGSIIGGLFTNLPFVIAPTSVISIFLSINLQSSNIGPDVGSAAVVLSGIPLLFLFYKPFGSFVGKLIPLPIQVGTTLGVGLLTALAGASEIKIVEQGKYALLQIGPVTTEVIIALFGMIAIGVGLFYHVKGAFVIGLISCSIVWWVSMNDWPSEIVTVPELSFIKSTGFQDKNIVELTFDLTFLYVLYLSGLIPTFTELSGLQREDGTTPRGRWFFIIAGVMTIFSGVITSAPILISPESSAAIKAGAKTGLSTIICGLLFLLSMFFAPVFQSVPAAATSPLLMMIGIILFQDVNRVNWKDIEDAAPAFVVLFFIPFTYSIINGVAVGYIVYIVMGLFTGTLRLRALEMMEFYFPEIYTKYFSDESTSSNDSDSAFIRGPTDSSTSSYQNQAVSNPMTTSPPKGLIIQTTSDLSLGSGLRSSTDSQSSGNAVANGGVDSPNPSSDPVSPSTVGRLNRGNSVFFYDRNTIRSIENVNAT